jgi:hypothetical protein
MLDDIRNWAGDVLSGKMKDAEIALTKQESTILRLKIDGLLDETSSLREERVSLRLKMEDQAALIADLTTQLEERDKLIAELKRPKSKVPDGFDEVTKRIAQFMAEHDGVSHEEISGGLGIPMADVRYHVGAMITARMAEQVSVGFVSDFGSSPPSYDLLQPGRAYARQ